MLGHPLFNMSMRPLLFGSILLGLASIGHAADGAKVFSFRPVSGGAGTFVRPDAVYSEAAGFGFEPAAPGSADGSVNFSANAKPFLFSVALPQGNYDVDVVLGDAADASVTTVKAECRRLMLENVAVAKGASVTRRFTVNIRNASIAGGDPVKLKPREKDYLHWDNRLTLEFSGARPAVQSLTIAPTTNAVTLFLLGDSTVTDQPREPFNSWGQMLTRFFKPGLAVANYAESGESLRSSLRARRLEKVLSLIRPGDFAFIQFGHNDQKEKGEGIGAFTSYKTDLKHYVDELRKRGGQPVLVTSVQRRNFNAEGRIVSNLGNYPEAVRRLAREEGVPLIDLHAMSKPLYEALEAKGKDYSKKAFAPGDNTHHNNYGSYQLAKCIVEGIRAAKLDLTKFLVDDVSAYDPSQPDPLEAFEVPASPAAVSLKPDGN
jgi:lysophospholipase L1-like esterase